MCLDKSLYLPAIRDTELRGSTLQRTSLDLELDLFMIFSQAGTCCSHAPTCTCCRLPSDSWTARKLAGSNHAEAKFVSELAAADSSNLQETVFSAPDQWAVPHPASGRVKTLGLSPRLRLAQDGEAPGFHPLARHGSTVSDSRKDLADPDRCEKTKSPRVNRRRAIFRVPFGIAPSNPKLDYLGVSKMWEISNQGQKGCAQ